MKKGISLPIEMIVIIAIAVLVLVVVAAFFTNIFGPRGAAIADNEAFAQGCNLLRTIYNCAMDPSAITIPNYRPPGMTSDQSLMTACARLGYVDANTCKQACACPAG